MDRQTGVRAVIDRPLLGDAIYEQLLSEILNGGLAKGERIRPDALAEGFGVSRTPLREALLRLSWVGFIETYRNSFTRVVDWGTGDIEDRVAVLVSLLGLVVGDQGLDLPRPVRQALRDLNVVSNWAPSRIAPVHGGLGTGKDDPAPFERSCAPDVDAFLAIAQQLVTTAGRTALTRAVEDCALAIRYFYTPAIAATYGFDLATRQAERAAIVNRLAHALAEGDEAATTAALDTYGRALRAETFNTAALN